MKIERKKPRGAEVYTASLNDIMFFLLLFFLIVATMATPMAIKVWLPRASNPDQIAAKKTIEMSITADRQYFIDGQAVTFDDIEPTLKNLAGETTGEDRPNVLLQVDHTVDIQTVVKIFDIGNKESLKITLVVEKEQ